MKKATLIILCNFIFEAKAWPPKFGPEFTFTNDDLIAQSKQYKINPTFFYDAIKTPLSSEITSKWRKRLDEKCAKTKDCRIETVKEKHGKGIRVIYNNGFWFQVSMDTNVIEIQTQPNTRQEFLNSSEIMRSNIFEIANDLGLRPHWSVGGGHHNIDFLSAFNNDAMLFRNWLVDQVNHPELYWGILGDSPYNGPTITDLGQNSIDAFKKIIADFDKNKIDIYQLIDRIKNEVYISHPYGWNPKNYQNMNFNSITPNSEERLKRVEIRGVRPQSSFDIFLLQIKLFEDRLSYLKSLNRPLNINIPTKKITSFDTLIIRFRDYIYEMNGSFEEYLPLIQNEMPGFNAGILQKISTESQTRNMKEHSARCQKNFQNFLN